MNRKRFGRRHNRRRVFWAPSHPILSLFTNILSPDSASSLKILFHTNSLLISLLRGNCCIFTENIRDSIDDPGFPHLRIVYSPWDKRRSAERARRLAMINPLIQTIPVKYMMAITQFSDILIFLEGTQTDGTHDIIPDRRTESLGEHTEWNGRQLFSNRISRDRRSSGRGVVIRQIWPWRAVGFFRVSYPGKMKNPIHHSLYIR